MGSGVVLALIVLLVATVSLVFLVNAEGGIHNVPHLLERAGIPNSFVEQYVSPAIDFIWPDKEATSFNLHFLFVNNAFWNAPGNRQRAVEKPAVFT